MCDPIIDDSERVETEQFSREIVAEYLKERSGFTRYPLRHYSQLEILFEESTIKNLLDRLTIPVPETSVTVFGGYTGQFAECLRKLGMKVIFTDPLEEWVQMAANSGFEAYRYSAAQIPKDIIRRTELFATFECYPSLCGEAAIYTVLRFLSSRYGILFGESKNTVAEMDKEEGKLARLKSSFSPYFKVYSIGRSYREKGELKLYHFYSTVGSRKDIIADVTTMKLLYDVFSHKTCLTSKDISSLAGKAGISYEELLHSIARIINLYQMQIPLSLSLYFPDNMFKVCSKVFTLDNSLIDRS